MRCVSQVSQIYNASSIICSHFTDLHEILHTFQQHSVHLDTLHKFRFNCLSVLLIKLRKYSVEVFNEFMAEFLRDLMARAKENFSHCFTKLALSQSRRLKTNVSRHQDRKPHVPSVIWTIGLLLMQRREGRPYGAQKIQFRLWLEGYSARISWKDQRDACADYIFWRRSHLNVLNKHSTKGSVKNILTRRDCSVDNILS